MKRQVRAMALVALLAVAAWLLMTNLGRSADDDKAVKDNIMKIADGVAKGGKVDEAKAADFAKKDVELEAVMHLFKPPAKKGVAALGPKGIELGLVDLSKKGSTKTEDVTKAAAVIQAIAAVAKGYKGKEPGSKNPGKWTQYSDEMQKAGKDLQDAADAKDNAKMKTAATNVINACTKCHEEFR